jgi:hypothetical protein
VQAFSLLFGVNCSFERDDCAKISVNACGALSALRQGRSERDVGCCVKPLIVMGLMTDVVSSYFANEVAGPSLVTDQYSSFMFMMCTSSPGDAVRVPAEVVEVVRQVRRADVPDMRDRIVAATAVHFGVPIISRDGRIRTSNARTVSYRKENQFRELNAAPAGGSVLSRKV